jgi:hypothetical protein
MRTGASILRTFVLRTFVLEIAVRSFAVVLLLLAACRPPSTVSSGTQGGSTTGAAGPRAAVDGFLAAVKSQDLQAMSGYWGSERGPAREALARDVLEKRELIMQCYLSHDRYNVLSEMSGDKGRRVLRVSLSKGGLTKETNFTAVQGPADRWYVEEVDLSNTAALCNSRG